MLDRNAAMRPVVDHRRHDAGLPIAPLKGADARRTPQRRFLPVGGSDEARPDSPPVGENSSSGRGRGVDPTDGEGSQKVEPWERRDASVQHPAQHTVLDDITEWSPSLELAMVVMQV